LWQLAKPTEATMATEEATVIKATVVTGVVPIAIIGMQGQEAMVTLLVVVITIVTKETVDYHLCLQNTEIVLLLPEELIQELFNLLMKNLPPNLLSNLANILKVLTVTNHVIFANYVILGLVLNVQNAQPNALMELTNVNHLAKLVKINANCWHLDLLVLLVLFPWTLISLNFLELLNSLLNPVNISKTSIAKKPVVFAPFAILHEAEIKLNVRLFVPWASTPVPMFVKLDNKDVLGLLN
jgi:hypothetical protein